MQYAVGRRLTKKLKQHLAYIDAQLSEYESQLDAADKLEDQTAIQEKIEERKEKQVKYSRIKEEANREPIVSEGSLPRNANPAKTVIYVHKVKPMAGI